MESWYGRDGFGRTMVYPYKTRITCPQKDEKTAVILLIGQSNIDNSGAQNFRSEYGDKVVNYSCGECYIAESPLLGSTGQGGEWGTLLGNNLIKQKTFNKVVLISSAISGSSILSWQPGKIFNLLLLEVLSDVKELYKIDYIIWHQGEEDWITLDESKYTQSLSSLVGSVRQAGVNAPFFVSTTTHCREPGWFADNAVARAQMASRNESLSIFLGVNTDKLLLAEDRYDDCHLSESGQEKLAEEYAKIIHNHRLD